MLARRSAAEQAHAENVARAQVERQRFPNTADLPGVRGARTGAMAKTPTLTPLQQEVQAALDAAESKRISGQEPKPGVVRTLRTPTGTPTRAAITLPTPIAEALLGKNGALSRILAPDSPGKFRAWFRDLTSQIRGCRLLPKAFLLKNVDEQKDASGVTHNRKGTVGLKEDW